jgi:hypothetical protein
MVKSGPAICRQDRGIPLLLQRSYRSITRSTVTVTVSMRMGLPDGWLSVRLTHVRIEVSGESWKTVEQPTSTKGTAFNIVLSNITIER